jgi:hypothetical protein
MAKKTICKVAYVCISGLGKIHLVKNPTKVINRAYVEITRMHNNYASINHQKMKIMVGVLIGLVGVLTSYQISYFIYRSFGLEAAPYSKVVAGQIFSTIIQSIVPLPGGIGIADSGFYFILKPIFTEEYINFALLLWRIFTFYLPILMGMVLLLGTRRKTNQAIK